jgi:hypothetical protein
MLSLPTAKPPQRRSAAPKKSAKQTGGWFKVANSLIDQAVLAKLSGSAVKVFLAIVRHTDRSGSAWPSRRRISDLTGVSIRMVTIALTELQSLHLLSRRITGAGRCNRYQLPHIQGRNPLPPSHVPTCPTPGNPLPLPGATQCSLTRPMNSNPNKKSDLLRSRREEQDAKAATLASLSEERIALLKQTVLAKLPPFTAAKLADKDARTSPILTALIAGELALGEKPAVVECRV